MVAQTGGKCEPLISMSLIPAGVWGAGVSGMPWCHIARLRKAVHNSMFKHTAGRSATVDLALLSKTAGAASLDPAVKATADPIYMLHSALWEGWVPRAWLLRTLCTAHASAL